MTRLKVFSTFFLLCVVIKGGWAWTGSGTYDWCITNPSPELEMMFIASGHGNIGGRKDNYVFEAGMHYMFNVSLDGDYDRVDVGALPT